MNLNDLAKIICEEEGGKEQLSIAQVKEVIGILSEKLAKPMGPDLIVKLIQTGNRRLKKKGYDLEY